MPSELDTAAEEKEFEASEEPRDRTKLVWLLVTAAFAVMIAALWVTQKPDNTISMARCKHILIKANMADPSERQQALVRAKELRKRLLEGADFERMAKEYSNDPQTSQRGGDLGYSKRGDYDDAFDDFVWNGPLNEISDLIRTSHGYHLVVVTYRNFSAADQHEQDIQRQELDEQKKADSETTPEK